MKIIKRFKFAKFSSRKRLLLIIIIIARFCNTRIKNILKGCTYLCEGYTDNSSKSIFYKMKNAPNSDKISFCKKKVRRISLHDVYYDLFSSNVNRDNFGFDYETLSGGKSFNNYNKLYFKLRASSEAAIWNFKRRCNCVEGFLLDLNRYQDAPKS